MGLSVGVGNLGSREFDLVANAKLAPDLVAGRFSFAHRERDGFYQDVDSDEAYDNRDRQSFRGQLLFTPDDAVEARFIADYTQKDESCCPAAFWIAGPTSAVVAALGGDITPFEEDGDQNVGVNFEPFEEVDDWGLSLDVFWEVNENIKFRSVTAYREYEVLRAQDIDFTNADILYPTDIDEAFENFSQEFQLYGSTGDFSWLVGAYLYTEELKSDEYVVFSNAGGAYVAALFGNPDFAPLFMGDPAGRDVPGQGYDALYFSDIEGWSLFTHSTWQASPVIDITVGLRYSWEERTPGNRPKAKPAGCLKSSLA